MSPLREYHKNGQLWFESWRIDGKLHRLDGPAWQNWSEDGQLHEEWWVDGKQVKPVQDPLEWALWVAKSFGNVHGLDEFLYDNLEEKTARTVLASVKII